MSVTSDIQQLYVAYFNRPADPIGLAYWTNVANANGGSTAAISAAFSTSPEYTATYAGLSPAEVVNAVYLNLFGRPAEPAGLTYWAPLIGNGKITIANVVTQIAAGAQGTDSAALQNKVTAATLFTNHLDTSPKILGYTGSAANNVGKAYVAGVTDAVSLLAATNSVDASISNAVAAHTAGTTGATVTLTTGLDTLTSAAGNAVFTANIVNNTNTFQSGDTLTATGAGNTLNADLGNSANFAILATTKGIQTVNITAEAQDVISTSAPGTNNLTNLPVQINALRMGNVTNYGDVQSRADVIIENIQLPNGNVSSDVTSAVTFTMRDTQPGSITTTGNGTTNVTTIGPSFRAYFNPQALKNGTPNSSATIIVEAGDATAKVSSAQFAAAPENNIPFTGISFLRDGVRVNINFRPQDVANLQGKSVTLPLTTSTPTAPATGVAAGTQADLTAAVQNALTDYNAANGTNLKAPETVGGYLFSSNDVPSVTRTASSYEISEAGHVLTVATTNAFILANGAPSVNGTSAQIIPGTSSTTNPLITSNIVVDNVGQGGSPQFANYSGATEGPGGDILIGSMATSGGVQQFNIDVQRTSWNNSVQTTNNVLQVVNIVSDALVVPTAFDPVNGGGQGYAIGAEISPNSRNMTNYATAGDLVQTNGLRDVQTIDATKFNGSLEIGERIDYAGFVRYLQGSNAIVPFSIKLGDDTNGVVNFGHTKAFNSVNLAINAAVVASGNFAETITGGAGDSVVNLSILEQNDIGLANNNKWIDSTTSLQNVVVNVLSGNNTVVFNGAGAAQIHGGAGNDAYYVDNSGTSGEGFGLQKAVFVANAVANNALSQAAPTATIITNGTPGTFGTAQVSFVNVAPNASTTNTFHTVEDVAVNGTNAGNINTAPTAPATGNPAGDDLQGVQVIYNQAVATPAVVGPPASGGPNPGISTATIAADVLLAYRDYAAAHTNAATGIPVETVTTGPNGLNPVMWETSTGNVVTVPAATDVLVETFTTSTGDTLQVTIGNEYVVSQTATQSAQGIVSLVRTQTGPTSFAYDGQSAAVPAANPGSAGSNQTYTTAPGDAPSSNGTQVNGTASGTEQDLVTYKSLQGLGASETIDGITVTDTQAGGATTYTAAQVAAAVMAGNGTYGKLVVSGEGAATPPANTGYTPVNVYATGTAPATIAPGASFTYSNGVTVTNNTATAIPASAVAADVAKGNVPGVVITNTNTVAASQVTLNYDTVNAVPVATPAVGTSTGGIVASNLATQVSIDGFGNLTTNVAQGGAPLKTFTGAGETVTLTYEGVAVTAVIPSMSNGTYTTTDVNNAIVTAVNADATLSKLLHATQGSSNGSVILSSIVDGFHVAGINGSPTIVFGHTGAGITTGTASGTYTAAMATADSLALGQISSVQQGSGDGTTTGFFGQSLVGGDSSYVNNSNITDTGSNGASNVIDLSSNNAAVNAANNYAGGSANTVALTGNGNSVVTNYKVGNIVNGVFVQSDTISTVATHGVVINAVNDSFQMSYTSTNATATPALNGIAATTPGGLNITAADLAFLGVTTASGIDVGSSFATAANASGAATGAGIVVIEAAGVTSVYYTSNVAAPTAANSFIEAILVGVTPVSTLIHLV